ncbi:MAG: hypothetical protein EBQ58_02625, partial [Betaproteobacteria bacterium]|nr:hypothetical protein [Betaproteobacteria bacterium]
KDQSGSRPESKHHKMKLLLQPLAAQVTIVETTETDLRSPASRPLRQGAGNGSGLGGLIAWA